MALFFVGWAFWTLIYFIFVGQVSAHEAGAGVCCGFVAALWSASLRNASPTRFHVSLLDFLPVAKALAGLPAALAKVASAFAWGAAAGLEIHPAPHGRTAASQGREAVAILSQSLAPDSFVLRAPPQEANLLTHALERTARSFTRDGA